MTTEEGFLRRKTKVRISVLVAFDFCPYFALSNRESGMDDYMRRCYIGLTCRHQDFDVYVYRYAYLACGQ
jgi:hypothetical protein